ncbi:MAG: NTP transferase domain-containing protein [Chloroflexia bacterium]|nr:NTP transferase domain-containing protein [Chloroflexia bacterium]
MNIVIPMAGRGRRTNDYSDMPKPLADIHGKTMIEWVVKTLNIEGKYIFITRKYEHDVWNEILNETLGKLSKDIEIIEIDYVTEGPAASALLAKEFINNDESCIIGNCDQIMEWNSNDFLNTCNRKDLDGVVITQNQFNPKIVTYNWMLMVMESD